MRTNLIASATGFLKGCGLFTADCWANVRDLIHGLRISWVATASVVLATLMFIAAPQAQDLFLEVRGDKYSGTLYWVYFYLAVVFVWMLPVYVSSRWILERFQDQPTPIDDHVGVAPWVVRWLPVSLAMGCLFAVLVGQSMAATNAPALNLAPVAATVAEESEKSRMVCTGEVSLRCYGQAYWQTMKAFYDNVVKEMGVDQQVTYIYLALLAPALLLLAHFYAYKVGRRSIGLSWRSLILISIGLVVGFFVLASDALYHLGIVKVASFLIGNLAAYLSPVLAFLAGASIWFGIPSWLHRLPVWWLRLPALGVWWLPIVVTAAFVYLMLGSMAVILAQAEHPLDAGHLTLLPAVTALVAMVTWWILRPAANGKSASRNESIAARISPVRAIGKGILGIEVSWLTFAIMTLAALAALALCILHEASPIYAADWIYRGLVVPFLFGLLVPILTLVSQASFYVRAPVMLLAIVAISAYNASRTTIHDIRLFSVADHPAAHSAKRRYDLKDSVRRWARIHQCKLGKRSLYSDDPATRSDCPRPIIVAAAGGASRAAFLEGAVLGKLINGESRRGFRRLRGKLIPFEQQLFAISGVSGGALGAAAVYAALADAQLARDENGPTINESTPRKYRLRPPCVAGTEDTDWFKDAESRFPEKNWRDCLGVLLSGDFLTPVFMGMVGGDILGAPSGDDRAAVLEKAWERRYADLTGKPYRDGKNRGTFAEPIIALRRKVLEAGKRNWLPVLLLQGTSVTSGRRIITSDVDTLISNRSTQRITRTFRDAYDFHELANSPTLSIANLDWSSNNTTISGYSRGAYVFWRAKNDEELSVTPVVHRDADRGNSADYADGAVHSARHNRIAVFNSQRIYLFDATTGEQLKTVELNSNATYWNISLAPDDTTLVLHGNTAAYDIQTGELLWDSYKPNDHAGNPWTKIAGIDSNSKIVVEVFREGFVFVRDLKTGEVVRKFRYAEEELFGSATSALSADGRRLAVALPGGFIEIWNVETGERIKSIKVAEDRLVIDVVEGYVSWGHIALSKSGRYLAYSSGRKAVIHNLEDDTDVYVIQSQEWRKDSVAGIAREIEPFSVIEFSPDENGVLTVTGAGAAVRSLLRKGPPIIYRGGDGAIDGARFSHRNSRLLLTWDDNGAAYVFNLSRRSLVRAARTPPFNPNCNGHCDIRLSTAAALSARFPVISPHGNIRNTKGKIVDRVVDGGYFENFGAVTALELAEVLRFEYGLHPAIILINNEPQLAGMNCLTINAGLDYPTPPQSMTFSTFRSPLGAVSATRGARGTHAAVDLCNRIGEDNFAFITVQPDDKNIDKQLSMSWWLSKPVQKVLHDQAATHQSSINKRAYEKIYKWQLKTGGAPRDLPKGRSAPQSLSSAENKTTPASADPSSDTSSEGGSGNTPE